VEVRPLACSPACAVGVTQIQTGPSYPNRPNV